MAADMGIEKANESLEIVGRIQVSEDPWGGSEAPVPPGVIARRRSAFCLLARNNPGHQKPARNPPG